MRAADRGRRRAGTAETAAYLTAKAGLLERIAAERAAGGWASSDIDLARQAAARRPRRRQRQHPPAAAGTVTLEDQP